MSLAMVMYAGCVVLLMIKMLAISCYQGYFRMRFRAFVNVEDAAVFGRPALAVERPEVIRGMQAWRNDLENIPLFMALGGLAVALHVPGVATAWLCGVFTVARVLHTVTYLAGLQPWRTLSYAIGVACLIGLGGLVGDEVTTSLHHHGMSRLPL